MGYLSKNYTVHKQSECWGNAIHQQEGALFGLGGPAWILSHPEYVVCLVGTAMGMGSGDIWKLTLSLMENIYT